MVQSFASARVANISYAARARVGMVSTFSMMNTAMFQSEIA